MDIHDCLAEQFEAERPRLRAVAYRMLSSLSEAEDAVQEAWLHLSRSDTSNVLNLGGWLTTVVARICLNMLHARESRREESLEASVPGAITREPGGIDPEEEAQLAVLDSDVVIRADRVAMSRGTSGEVRGARAVARQLAGRAGFARAVLVNGAVGLVVAPRGRLVLLLRITIRQGKIVAIDAVADPAHLHQVRLAVLDD